MEERGNLRKLDRCICRCLFRLLCLLKYRSFEYRGNMFDITATTDVTLYAFEILIKGKEFKVPWRRSTSYFGSSKPNRVPRLALPGYYAGPSYLCNGRKDYWSLRNVARRCTDVVRTVAYLHRLVCCLLPFLIFIQCRT